MHEPSLKPVRESAIDPMLQNTIDGVQLNFRQDYVVSSIDELIPSQAEQMMSPVLHRAMQQVEHSVRRCLTRVASRTNCIAM